MRLFFITDPLVTTAGAVRPALLLAEQMRLWGHEVEIASTHFDEGIARNLDRQGLNHRKIRHGSLISWPFPTLQTWARSLIVPNRINSGADADAVINTSSSIVANSRVYYAQGIMTKALNEISTNFPVSYQSSYKVFAPLLSFLERMLVIRFRLSSKLFIANSNYCSSLYKELGINVDSIIYPPMNTSLFRPTTNKPSEDYVLTHIGAFGKEGSPSVIGDIANSGVKIRIFGTAPRYYGLLGNKNVSFLGKVCDAELADLYSNAVFTLFAFNHEPFGYIPIESMACGTPVITFSREGPAETVANFETGWLVKTEKELVRKAMDIWKEGVAGSIRFRCRKKALTYDVKTVASQWLNILK